MNALQPLLNNSMATLIRREFWEHRALWITPLVVAGLLLFGVITGAVLGKGEIYFDFAVPDAERRSVLAIAILSMTAPQYLMMLIMLFFYLIDCLYTERKDRSILFWKSMPVSDSATVASKLLVALVAVPVGVFLLTCITDLVVAAIMGVALQGGPLWDTWTWIKLRAAMIPGLAILLLWYVPVAGYLILLSAWARRNVFLWVVLPPLLLVMIEMRGLDTHYLGTFLEYRLFGVWKYFGSASAFANESLSGGLPPVGQLFETVGATRALADIDLWLGIAAGIALAYAAVRIRRYRDDT